MKGKKAVKTGCILFICFGLMFFFLTEGRAQTVPALLKDADCVKCHTGQPRSIATAGAAHQDVACTDCHQGHRPLSQNNIPACDECHEGEPHFEIGDCLVCHNDPHKPLEIILGDDVTEPCLSCHDGQIVELRENESSHTDLDCSYCHDEHGRIPPCLDCHDAHSGEMVATDCGKCHRAHMPAVISYGQSVLNKDCAACHDEAFGVLSAGKAMHATLSCVSCHKDGHGMIPECMSCHPAQHPESITARFPRCGDCHYIAHDLNNWPPEEK